MSEKELAEELEAKQAFHELNMKYARGVDRCDAQLLREVWWEDATVDFGIFKGNAHEFSDFIVDMNMGMERTFHSLSNEYYQVDGDRGVGETYVIGISTAEADGQKMDGMVGGRYLDKFERRKGVWRSSHRLFVMDWNMNFPATAEWEEGMYGQIRTHGQRDHSDPVFKLWESLT